MALLIPEYLQTKKYSAGRVRGLMMDMPFQRGVLAAGDLKVTQRAAGANKTVDIAAGSGWVQGSHTARQGFYHVVNDAVVNLTIPDNATGNPRLDQIVCRINDTTDGGSVADNAVFEVVPGTPTSGATLDNRNGFGTLPTSCLLIADVLAPAGFSSITNSAIRDRRPWARGAFRRIARTGGNFSTTSTSLAAIDTTNFASRMECTGVPVEVTWSGLVSTSTAARNNVDFGLFVDGAGVDSTTIISRAWTEAVGGAAAPIFGRYVFVPAAGSHLIAPTFASGSGVSVSLLGTAANPAVLTIRELIVQNADNT